MMSILNLQTRQWWSTHFQRSGLLIGCPTYLCALSIVRSDMFYYLVLINHCIYEYTIIHLMEIRPIQVRLVFQDYMIAPIETQLT